MIKVKDGYAKLIGTTYQGSATQVLLSNGGNLEFSSTTKANTLVQRSASQYIYATYFNSAISDEALTDIGSVYVRNTSDTFIRRISKTQFYSIIDNKFVTLDTAQTITGVKTFSTGPILANNATITQNQNSTSNYTTVVKWLKGGTSQGTYNPSIGQHNTGGDGTGSICILPYPTSTDPWGGTVGLFISKGVLKLDGQTVIHSGNYDSYFGYIGTTKVQKTSAAQALTGISSINGRLTINAESDLTRLGFGGVHTVVFGEPGYAHRGYYFRPAYSASGTTQAAVYIQNASAAASPTWTTTHTFSANGNATHAGAVIVGGDRYWTAEAYGLQLNNSDIVGANGIYFADLVDSAGEGIHFYRSATTWDTLTAANGLLYFSPNRATATHTLTPLFSSLANSGNNISITVGGQNRTLTVAYASNAGTLGGQAETAFYRTRGTYGSITSNIPTTAELSTNNGLNGSWIVSYTGASGHLMQFNAGGGSTRYVQLYSHYSSSLYWRNSTDSTLSSKPWRTIVDSANYTGIVLKIGTATKGSTGLPIYLNAGVPTACNSTLTVSITGNAATATKLQTARTINGTTFDGTTNITTAYWGTARTITLSGAVTGSASVNGSQNVTIATTYQTGSIDGRYVGGNKTANHGSSRTAYTADSYSSTFARKEFVAFAERGSWAYANNGYVTTDTGVNIPLAGTAVFQWGASDTNKTQLFITPYNNSGVSNPAANEMLFYTSNGSGYTSAWTRVLTHRNYTAYTVTKTGGGASGTWGISITGSAPWANITGRPTLLTLAGITSLTNKDLNYARYNFGTTNKGDDSTQLNVPANYGLYLSLAYSDKNQGGQIFFNTVPGTTGTLYFRTRNAGDGNTVNTWKPWKTVLDSTNYTAYFNPANYYWANIKVSASSSTATQPTFNTCYTSNWFRSQGGTGWYNQSYAGGVYMNENYWVKTYGGTMMYIAPDAHAWGIGGHNIAMKLYHSSHIGINFATSAYTWGIYANSNGNMYIGRRSGNVNDSSGTYYHTLTASYISSPGFYHSAIGSNSYVLLAGGSYKGLGDFAKGNAGSATKGVYVTGGTVTAMTYSLSSNLNSGTSGKLAYYSSATTVAAYSSSVGASNRGIYMNAGVPTVMAYYLNATVNSGTSGKLAYYSSANTLSNYTTTVGSAHQPVYMNAGVPTICSYYSFLGTSQQPVVLVSGYFYRNSSTSNSWYYTGYKHSQIGSPTFYVNGGVMRLTFSNSKQCSFISAAAQGRQSFSGSNTANVQAYDGSNGNYSWRSEGSYWFNSVVTNSSYTSYLYIRAYRQANSNNDSWYTGDICWKQEEDAIQSVSFTIFGYIYP